MNLSSSIANSVPPPSDLWGEPGAAPRAGRHRNLPSLSFFITHLDCGSETARNPNLNLSPSWSWSWTGSTGQTSPHMGWDRVARREDKNNLSPRKRRRRERCSGRGDTQLGPQKLTQKVPEAPGPEHPRPKADRRTVHTPPQSTAPSPTTPPVFTGNAMAFLLPLRNVSFLAIPGAQITSPFPQRLGRRTGNWALHEREGSTSVTACLWALPSSSESWLWCLGNSGKVWNRKGRHRDPASPSAPCFLTACPKAE